ncbi:MAG: replication factor C small subunit [Candidatus Aenigmarchaeota archaeon]|nr:replication factor C small subunit [Candidatus Aenigmarchaeota archaeon]
MSLQVWTEKYRPQKLSEIVNQAHVVDRLNAWVKEGSIPNMLFAGPAGIGKTTAALALAHELFGENWKDNFQETNASDQRGIDVVRGRIKNFAMVKPLGSDFKIIFLDESDSLTPEAQQALRRTMEKYSDVCRFILSCNYSSRIIEPIQSRCSVFRFRRLAKDDVRKYAERIAKNEKLKMDDGAYNAVFEVSEGDLRKATNVLQACSTLESITEESVYSMVSQVNPDEMKELIELSLSGNFSGARKKLYELIVARSLSGEDILKAIHTHIFRMDIDEKKKLALIEILGEYEFRLNQGSTPEIQLEAMLAQFMKVSGE